MRAYKVEHHGYDWLADPAFFVDGRHELDLDAMPETDTHEARKTSRARMLEQGIQPRPEADSKPAGTSARNLLRGLPIGATITVVDET